MCVRVCERDCNCVGRGGGGGSGGWSPPIIFGAQSKTDFSHEHRQTTRHMPWTPPPPATPKHLPTPLHCIACLDFFLQT